MSSAKNEDIVITKREYFRKWRRENPEKVQAAQERYWLKKAAERRDASRESNDSESASAE